MWNIQQSVSITEIFFHLFQQNTMWMSHFLCKDKSIDIDNLKVMQIFYAWQFTVMSVTMSTTDVITTWRCCFAGATKTTVFLRGYFMEFQTMIICIDIIQGMNNHNMFYEGLADRS